MLRPRAREGAQNVTLEMFMHCGWWELPGDGARRAGGGTIPHLRFRARTPYYLYGFTDYKRQDSTLPLLI